ncbi:MAG: primosomal protein N' [Dehalococcoidales bacterium]|nr:primosomal protein N' [Dehalococcoidales bacterium]
MGYAEVCVNSPAAQRRTFSYAIPYNLNIQVGQAVFVPFGAKLLQGIVLKLTEQPAVEETREIAGIIEPLPMLSSEQVELAYWLSDYYLASIFDVVALMLPPGFGRKALTFLTASYSDSLDLSSLTEEQCHAIELVRLEGRISQKKLGKALGQKKSQSLISQLVRLGLLSRSYELEPIKARPRVETYLNLVISTSQVEKEVSKSNERQTANQASLLELLAQQSQSVKLTEAKKACKCDSSVVKVLGDKGLLRSFEKSSNKSKRLEHYLGLLVSASEAMQMAAWLRDKITNKQVALLSFLAGQKEPVELSTVYRETKSNRSVVNALIDKGLITLNERDVRRDPLATYSINLSLPLNLAPNQAAAFRVISQSLVQPPKAKPEVFLLHGVTGSGKTEIYLQSLAEVVKLGKKGIALVPEIALTPQTIERFAARFPGRVAILHSQLSLGERFDEWQRIRNGEFDVVIGPRSALFAPQPDLGLIVIDEEHEWNYKQSDRPPFYHARHAAIKLAELTGSVVILGSATPDVETYYHARKGDYHLLKLPERVTPSTLLRTSPMESAPMPQVEVIDMKDELRAGNRSLFSRALSQAISGALAGVGQVILFLNRRGSSTFVQCRQCGFTVRCRRCDVPLTYHSAENVLICHQCNKRTLPLEYCTRCRSRRIKFLGMGTEKLEEETSQAFPQAKLLRWDSDTTRQGYSHQEILDKFRNHQADILIGTQMVSKGLDLPQVTLVGVINADTGLNLPDFRAGERTFQLLSQVAGRTGRGPLGGQAIIQTYSPEHYAIQAAAKHDYDLFYEKEIDYRCELHQPPFTRLARLIYTNSNDIRCREEAERMKRALTREKEAKGIADLSIIGPAPAFIHRRRSSFRWQLILRGSNPSAFLSEVPIPQGWTIDIDPVGLS